MELRDKIADEINSFIDYSERSKHIADRILAIPEIAIALKYRPKAGGHMEVITKDGGRVFVPAAKPNL